MPDEPVLAIHRIATETLHVPIVGTAALIVSKFSEKAKRKILGSQQGQRMPKEVRDPDADYEASMYRFSDGYGFPANAFKLCTVGAARFYGRDVKMTDLRQFLWFEGDWSDVEGLKLTRIEGEPKMREDYVRLAGPSRGTDLRYRAEFREWRALLRVRYAKSCLSRESVLSLIDAGGMGIGVGEWRPEHKGDFGTFTIDEAENVRVEGQPHDLKTEFGKPAVSKTARKATSK